MAMGPVMLHTRSVMELVMANGEVTELAMAMRPGTLQEMALAMAIR